jgi:iron complex transport system substrate-binding protein
MQKYLSIGFLLFLFACQTTEKKTSSLVGKEKTAPFKIQYAQNFSVRYFDTHKELTVRLANKDNKNVKKYALVKRGQPSPAGFSKEQIIEIPVRTCVLGSHTHIACLQALGLEDKLVGLTEATYLPDSSLLQKIQDKKVLEVGKGGDWQTELLFSLKPDLIMLNSGDESKLNLPTQTKKVVNTDWQETHPVGRAEWLFFVSLFFDAEEKALPIVGKIKQEYETLREAVGKAQRKPQQVILDVPYKGTWYIPAGKSYMATLLKDAGATYAWAKTEGVGSLTLDFEAVYAEAQKATFWLNVLLCKSQADITALDSRLANIPALKAGKVYNYHKRSWKNGTNPYFMHSILQPHLLLADLVKILHPDFAPNQKHNLYYYEQVR